MKELKLYAHSTEVTAFKDGECCEMMKYNYGILPRNEQEIKSYLIRKYGEDVEIHLDTIADELVFKGWKAIIIKWLIKK